MTEDTDIIVVGGGVAGSSAARAAASLGFRVAVFEEHAETGVPVHCPAHLTATGMRTVGLKIPDDIVQNQIRGGTFYSPDCTPIEIRYTETVSTVANRAALDKHLAAEAEEAGARFNFNSKVRRFKLDNNRVTGVVTHSETSTVPKSAAVTIDAAGASYHLAKHIGLRTPDRTEMVYGVHAEVDSLQDVQENMVETYFGGKYAPGFYAWIIPNRDGTGKVGLASNRGHTETYLKNFVKHHPVASDKLKHSRITSASYYPIPLCGPIPRTYAPGLLIAGHAASQVKPTSGGGILFGMLCGRIAGEVAAQAVNTGKTGAEFLARYERRWKKVVGRDMVAMTLMRGILDGLTDRQIDRAFRSMKRIGTPAELQMLGHLLFSDMQGRKLLGLFRRPKTLSATVISLLSMAAG